MLFFKKKPKCSKNYAPLEPGEEAQALANDVPRPLTFDGVEYTVLDEVVWREKLYLICTAQGRMVVLGSDGADHCTAPESSLANQVYAHYLLQPK